MLALLPDIRTAFESRILKTNSCWLWQGPTTGEPADPYGLFIYANERHLAHVFALKLDGRSVPKDMQGLHHCDTPLCVRPSHLYVGTQKMNGEDAWKRIRTDYGVNHHRAKLSPDDVLEMRRMRLKGIPFRRIAHSFNASYTATRSAILNETWRYQPEKRCARWESRIGMHRTFIATIIEHSPSLAGYPARKLADAYHSAGSVPLERGRNPERRILPLRVSNSHD
jgi:hypothetical protein